jgi:hypothetical protein
MSDHLVPTALALPDELLEAIAERVAELLAERLPAPPDHPIAEDGRLALQKGKAAAALDISPDSFERHVLPKLQVTRVGSLKLVSVAELERYIAENSARLGER